ncbi:MAG: ribonuclease HI [Anaerolineales bacterium]
MRNRESTPVDAYTDGSSVPNPGPGGWCALLVVRGRIRTLSGAEAHTTNNRMELRAAIEVFKALSHPADVWLHTDSEYLRLGITRWVDDWRRRGWRTRTGDPVANLDLWKELLEAMGPHRVEWDWVQAHSGNALNERADRLARKLAARAGGGSAGARSSPGPSTWHLLVWGSAQPSRSEWGYLLQRGAQDLRGYGELPRATANQLVLRAAIEGLRRSERGARIILQTNSEYLSKGIENGLVAWPRRGWKTASGRAVQNLDLWQELLSLLKDRTVEIGPGGLPEAFKSAVRKVVATERSMPGG